MLLVAAMPLCAISPDDFLRVYQDFLDDEEKVLKHLRIFGGWT